MPVLQPFVAMLGHRGLGQMSFHLPLTSTVLWPLRCSQERLDNLFLQQADYVSSSLQHILANLMVQVATLHGIEGEWESEALTLLYEHS